MSYFDHDEIEILGKAGKDCEMRFLADGKPVASFSVAVDRSYKKDGGEIVKRTIWYRVSVFGKFAEVCNQRVQKGGKLFVKGELTPDYSTGSPKIYNKQDGTPATGYDVTATTVRFLSQVSGSEKPVAAADFLDENPFA